MNYFYWGAMNVRSIMLGEQELREQFEKDSLFRQFDLLKNECGQYENIETHRAFQGFSKGYSLSKKTIEKQKKENEKLKKTLTGCHKYIKEVPIDCGFVNEFLALTNTIEQCLGKETLGE